VTACGTGRAGRDRRSAFGAGRSPVPSFLWSQSSLGRQREDDFVADVRVRDSGGSVATLLLDHFQKMTCWPARSGCNWLSCGG